jgi:TP901 family phage tail tape measure protein
MAKPLIIPSIFTAEDKLSPAIRGMSRSLDTMAMKSEAFGARSERAFRKLTPALSAAGKQMLSMVGTAALVGGAFQLGKSSIDSIMDYETAMQSLQAVTGVSNEGMVGFKKEVDTLAKSSRKSAIDVASSFETIGSAMSQYLEDPKGLRQIAEAGITLSKAGRTELQPTLENLTSIMNQFGLKAEDAAKSVNTLTAGEIVGSVRTSEAAGYLQEFGATAKNMNVDLAESTALIEALGVQMAKDKIAVGARNLLTTISAAGGLDKKARADMASSGVSMKFLMDSSNSLSSRLRELSKVAKDPIKMVSIFGKENVTAGQVIFNQLDTYDKYLLKIRSTTKANEQADLNSNTLSNRLSELGNAWTNMLTSSDKASSGLERAKGAIQYVTDNLGTIVSVGVGVLKFFALWKASIMATSLVTGGLNIAMGIQGALTGIVSVAVGKSALAMKAYEWSTKAVTAATWLWNAALSANPIGLVIAAVAGLVAGIAYLASQYQGWGDQWDIMMTGMGYSIDTFVYGAKSMWGVMSDAFSTTIDGMKIMWYGFQNATGGMSDAAYSAEKTKMRQSAKDRQNYIKENQSLANLSAMNALLYTNNVLTRKGSTADVGGDEAAQSANRQQKIKDLESSYVMKMVTSRPGVKEAMDFKSTKVATNENITTTNNNANANATITIKNDGNAPVDVNKGGFSSFNIMPNMSSTMNTSK